MVRFALTLLPIAVLLLACGAPTAQPTPAAADRPDLALIAYYRASPDQVQLTFTNRGATPVYLPVCGPWEIVSAGDPDRPVWFIACEIDYLGYRVEPGESLVDALGVDLDPGNYQARTSVFGECELGEPKSISPQETYYGEFGACAVQQEVMSPTFIVQ